MEDSSKEHRKNIWKIVKSYFTYAICLAFNGYISWRTYETLRTFKEDWSDSKCYALSISFPICLLAAFIALEIVRRSKCCNQQDETDTYQNKSRAAGLKDWFLDNQTCHIPTLLFLLFTLWNYGLTLHHSYLKVNPEYLKKYPELMERLGSTNSTLGKSCAELQINLFDFYAFQLGIPMLIAIQLFYPFPSRKGEDFKDYLILGLNFVNSLDIMDLVTHIGCIQNSRCTTFFYVTQAFSVLIIPLSFNPKWQTPDTTKKDQVRKKTFWWRIILSLATALFSDVFPFIIRLYIMGNNKESKQSGFNFKIKEFISALLYCYLAYICHKEIRAIDKKSNYKKKDAADRILKSLSKV